MVNNLQQEVSRAVEHFYQSVLSESHSNDDELSVVLPVIITCYNMILTDRVDDFYRLQRANEDEVEATLLDELQQLSNQHPGYEEWVSIVREDIKRFSSSKYPNACYLIYVTVNTLSSLSFDEWCLNKEHCGGLFFDHLLVTIFNNVGVSSAEFYNSPPIAKLVALLADSDRGMSLYDPTCGVGSFLLSSAKGDCELYGQELNRKAWSIAKMNLFMHNHFDNKVFLGDTLLAPQTSVAKFDRVVACPPFSASVSDKLRFSYDNQRFPFGVPEKKADYAFIQHILSSLKACARGVVVVSPGILFRSGSDKKIRTELIKSNVIKAVISLPSGLIYGSNISSAILILETGREKSDRQIQFINASEEYTVKSRQHKLSEDNISQIISWFQNTQPEKGKVVFKSIEEVEKADFDLTVSRYTFESEELEYRPIADIRSEQLALTSELESLKIKMEKMLNEVSDEPS